MSSSEHAAERSVVVGARVPAGPSMTRWGGGHWEEEVGSEEVQFCGWRTGSGSSSSSSSS